MCILSNTATILYGYTYKNKEGVCLSYWKTGVVPFFQDIEWKKVELYNFFGNYPKNNVKLCGFSESYSLKNGDMVIRETHVRKKWSYIVFLCLFKTTSVL